jgi:hypothetical protein
MVPIRSLLLVRLLRSAWCIAAVALGLATLLEWGLIADDPLGIR